MTDSMRCLSVHQPWAWAICVGEKTIENRTWDTPYRGTIAIMASSSTETLRDVQADDLEGAIDESLLPLGAIVGVVDLVDVVDLSEEIEDDPWAVGPKCWILENARLLAEPIPYKGKLKLFHLEDEVAAQIAQQLAEDEPELDDERVDRMLDAVAPTFFEAYLMQTLMYQEHDRPDDAERVLGKVFAIVREATEEMPDEPGPWQLSAGIKWQFGDEEGSRQDYERLRELDPSAIPFDEFVAELDA